MVSEYAPDSESLQLEEAVEPAVAESGFKIVELRSRTVKGQLHVHVVLYGAAGTTIDDLADVHRAILPIIEESLDGRDLNLEVSTPGIERTFKSRREFRVFEGRGVRVLLQSTQDWVGGVIASTNQTTLELRREGEIERVPYDNIVKAKLDYTQEEGREDGIRTI